MNQMILINIYSILNNYNVTITEVRRKKIYKTYKYTSVRTNILVNADKESNSIIV